VIQPTLWQAAKRYIEAMKPRSSVLSEQVEASKVPASPEAVAGAVPQGAEGSEPNVPPRGGGEAGRILFGLAVLGVGLLAANRGRQ